MQKQKISKISNTDLREDSSNYKEAQVRQVESFKLKEVVRKFLETVKKN